MVKILITGGSGLIGYEFISNYHQEFEIISYDKREPETRYMGVQYVTDELRNIGQYREIFSDIDGIIHLASISRVIAAETKPLETWETNVWQTAQFMSFIGELRKKPWVIFGSSREVFGENPTLPVSDDSPLQPINIYGKTKVIAEGIIEAYTLKNKRSSLVMRFSNVYGNTNDYRDRVIPKFLINAMSDMPLEVHGRDNLFDFTHVQDTARAIKLGVDFLEMNDEVVHYRLLICTNKGTPLIELAKIIVGLTDSKSDILVKEPRDFDVQRFYGDYSKAKEVIGYQPEIKLVDGIKKFISVITQSNWLLRGK